MKTQKAAPEMLVILNYYLVLLSLLIKTKKQHMRQENPFPVVFVLSHFFFFAEPALLESLEFCVRGRLLSSVLVVRFQIDLKTVALHLSDMCKSSEANRYTEK